MNTIHRVLITVANWTLSAVSPCILCAFVIEQFNHGGHWEYKSLRTTERVISNRFRYNRLTGHRVAIVAVFGVRNRGPPSGLRKQAEQMAMHGTVSTPLPTYSWCPHFCSKSYDLRVC